MSERIALPMYGQRPTRIENQTHQDHQLYRPITTDLEVSPFPPMVVVDITNVCNLSCVHCEQPKMRVQPGYKPQQMGLPLFKKIADECADHQESVMRVLGDGEPLMVPAITSMVEYAKAKGIKPIGITTAGVHLDDEKTDRFLKAGLDYIDFSLDAYSKEMYDQIRVGSRYHRVMGNIHRFLDRRDVIQDANYQGDRTKVLVNMIDQPPVHHEIEAFKQHWEPLVDRVFIRPFHSVVGLVDAENPTLDSSIERWPCRYLWERLEITSGGEVMHCSQAWGRESALVGNVNDQTIAEIWQGSVMQKLREHHLKGEFPDDSLCGGCRDWKTINWDPKLRYSSNIKELTS